VFPIQVPALRDRREDIPALASRFLATSSQSSGRYWRIRWRRQDALMRFDGPGNGRQLQNETPAVALAADGQTIAPPSGKGGPPSWNLSRRTSQEN